MFEDVVAEPSWVVRDHLPADDLADDFDGELERLVAEAEALLDDPVPSFGSREPSGELALDLDVGTADAAGLSDESLVEAIIGFDRLTSWAQARQARLLAELARRRPEDKAPHSARWACVGSEYAPDEVGVALRLSRGSACARIGLARRLLATLPDTHESWESGLIDTSKARAIDDATVVLSDEHAAKVEAAVLPKAPEQTLAQLKAALARAIIAVDPEGAEERHREARRDRRVVVTAEADGMGTLWAMLTAPDAVGAFTWLTRLARGLGSDDPRSMDVRRADILAALLNGRLVTNADTADTADTADGDEPAADGRPAGDTSEASDTAVDITTTNDTTNGAAPPDAEPAGAGAGRPIHPVTPAKPLIQIVIGYSTLIGADDQPAELIGHGPIPASLAREVAADGVWRRLVTDPLSGTLLDHGRTTYHPPAGLADFVRARDVYCRFPGCRRRAADAELDHVIAWSDGGITCEKNLDAYCTHHHVLKTHAPGWRVQAHPAGALTWTTPTGHQHTTRAYDYRPEPPPPTAPSVPKSAPPAPTEPDPDPPPF
jgi:hypothetical protein